MDSTDLQNTRGAIITPGHLPVLRRWKHSWILLLLGALTHPAPGSQAPGIDQRQGEVRRLLRLTGQLLPDIEESRERHVLGANLAARQVDAGDLPGALATAEAVGSGRAKANVISMIAISQAYKGNWGAALETAGKIDVPEIRSQARRMLVNIHLRHDNPEAALQLLNTFPGESAERVLGLIGIAHWYAKNGNGPEANRILGAAKGLALAHMDSNATTQEFLRNASFLAHAGSSQIRLDNRTMGMELLETVLSRAEKAPDEMTKKAVLRMVVSAYAAAGETALALDALEELTGSSKDHVLHSIVMERSNAHDFVTALAMARDIGDSQRRDDAYSMIAASQAGAGDEVGSRETLKLIADPYERTRTLEMIASVQIRKNPDEAATSLDRAEQEARELADDRERADVLEQLSADYSRLRDFDRALELALANPQPAPRGRALERALGAMAFRGETERAYRVAEEQAIPLVRAYAWMGIAEGLQARINRDRREAGKKTSQ